MNECKVIFDPLQDFVGRHVALFLFIGISTVLIAVKHRTIVSRFLRRLLFVEITGHIYLAGRRLDFVP